MQNWRFEPTGLAKSGKIRGLTGMGSDLVSQEAAGRVCWMVLEPNWIMFPVQTRIAARLPRPVANTTYDDMINTQRVQC